LAFIARRGTIRHAGRTLDHARTLKVAFRNLLLNTGDFVASVTRSPEKKRPIYRRLPGNRRDTRRGGSPSDQCCSSCVCHI